MMIPLSKYRQIQDMRISSLKKGSRRGEISAAKYMAAMARKLAPRDTGNLIKGIHRRKNTVSIRATNPINGFPYVHWVNQSKGFEKLHVMRYTDARGRGYVRIYGRWVVVPRNIMVYGQEPNWHWTGTARFATIARNSARQFFRETMLNEMRKSISLTG